MKAPSVTHLTDRSVTVVIATRDRPELLRRALDAVWSQDFAHPIEVIVVFDRSEPDQSLVRIDEALDRRIVVTTNVRAAGLAGARNSGIDAARNAWIAFCDDDDEWLDGKLAAQFAALEAQPMARAACTGIFIRYEGNDTARVPDPALVTHEGFCRDRMTEVHPSSWLVHRDTLVDQIGYVDEMLPGSYAEDYDLFLRTAEVAPIAVAEVPLVRVWWHGASFFFEKWNMIDQALDYLVMKHPALSADRRGFARIEGQRAVAQAAMGHRLRALRTAGRCVTLNPTERRVPVALAVAAGVPAGWVLSSAHRFGKGI
ncbi:MAG: glycosyltransferase family A protein [Actinomycetota bacterium]